MHLFSSQRNINQISFPVCFPLPQLSASPSLPFCLLCCCLSHQTSPVGGKLWFPASAGSVSRPAEHLLSGPCPPTSGVLLPALPLPGRSVLQAGQEPLSAHTLLFWAPWPTWATFLHSEHNLPRIGDCLEGQEVPVLLWPTQAADELTWTLLA